MRPKADTVSLTSRLTSRLVGQRRDDGNDVGALGLQLGGARHHVILAARANGERSALRRKRLGDRLPDLAVVANARDDGDLAFEIAGHFTLLGICAIVWGTTYTVWVAAGHRAMERKR